MADDQAWAIGAQIGSERAKEHRAHKQEMSDQQFQDKHDEIQGMIENLHDQLTAVPKDQRNTPDYLKMQDQLAQAIQDRNAHWKSVDQPNALSKFGKMLGKDLRFKKQEAPTPVAPPVYGQPTMDVNGEKVPTGPAYKVQGPQTPAQMKAAAEAAKLVAAGPVSPEQAATQQGKAESAKSLAEFQGKLKLYDQNHPEGVGPNATPEGKQARQDHINELINSTSGVKETKPIAENFVPVELLLSDGTKISGQRGKDGAYEYLDRTPIPPELLHGAKIESTAKPSTGTLNERFASYARDHDLPEGKMLSGPQMDYVKQKWTLDGLYPTSTTTTTFKQNLQGQWVPVTETNYRTPGGNITLVDPLGPVQPSTPDNKKGAQPPNAEPTKKTTPVDIKKQAEKLRTTSAGSGPGNVRVGQPILQGATPASKKADDEILEASNIDNLATIAEKAPQNMKAEKTRFLLGRLQKVMEGRFNQGAYENLSTKYGWDNTFQGWLNHISTGQLPDEIFKAIVSEAHDNLSSAVKAKQDLVANMKEDGGSDSSNASGGTQEFNENGKIYDIPADKVEAFKKKHPKAKEQ